MKSRKQPVGVVPVVPLALVLVLPGAVAAQPTDAAVDIAVGVGLTLVSSGSCQENGFVVDDCHPAWTTWSGSLAWHLTDRTAIVGEVRGTHVSQSTTVRMDGLSLPLEWDGSTYSFSAGVRRYLRSAGRRIAPFADVLAGYGRGRLTFAALPIRLGGSANPRAFVVAPGAGVDIYIVPRVAVRARGRWSIAYSEGEVSRGFALGAGMVFALGNR